MNDFDSPQEPITECDYIVDLDIPGIESPLEPRYAQRTSDWKVIHSLPFLHASKSSRIFRAFYIPFASEMTCQYGDYVLLQNEKRGLVDPGLM